MESWFARDFVALKVQLLGFALLRGRLEDFERKGVLMSQQRHQLRYELVKDDLTDTHDPTLTLLCCLHDASAQRIGHTLIQSSRRSNSQIICRGCMCVMKFTRI
eukprot:1302349-Pleurochrysis_carterae.AAC.3